MNIEFLEKLNDVSLIKIVNCLIDTSKYIRYQRHHKLLNNILKNIITVVSRSNIVVLVAIESNILMAWTEPRLSVLNYMITYNIMDSRHLNSLVVESIKNKWYGTVLWLCKYNSNKLYKKTCKYLLKTSTINFTNKVNNKKINVFANDSTFSGETLYLLCIFYMMPHANKFKLDVINDTLTEINWIDDASKINLMKSICDFYKLNWKKIRPDIYSENWRK